MIRADTVVYIYPMAKWVSFRSIAESHIKELRKYYNVQIFDEESTTIVFTILLYTCSPPIILHPFFYPIARYEKILKQKLGRIQNIIGVDVAGSNHISQYAVELTENAEALIVPSNFARNTYVNSGCRKPVYVVNHGVPDEWIGRIIDKPKALKQLLDYKKESGKKLIQTWVMHSWYRKGEDLAYEVFNKLVEERDDVALVVRRPGTIDVYDSKIDYSMIGNSLTINARPKLSILPLWLEDYKIEELMSICDIFLLTSRGGGFEHPPLLAMSKAEVVIGARGGAWEDYIPQWLLIDSHESLQLLPGNPIHDGVGVEIEVEKAVDKLHEIIDNMDEYKSRIAEYVNEKITEELTWSKIGLKLKEIIGRYIYEFIGRPVPSIR
jgi:glycosyltransferase involved in cell wall biosynthesis